MKKKILMYTMIMTKGGAEQLIANLANNFSENYDIIIVTNINCKSEYSLNKNVKYICIDKQNKSKENIFKKILTKVSKKRTKKLKKIIEEEKPDLVISFLPEPTIRLMSLKKDFSSIPFAFSIRNHPNNEFNLPFLKCFRNHYYQYADKIIIQDETYKKYLKENVWNKIVVIPNFISDNFMNVDQCLEKEKSIVTVGRLERQKRVDLLIDAFYALNKKFGDYKLLIYGDGKEKAKLNKQIKKLHLENKVILKGRVKSIPDEINNATLFVLASDYEGMPNALLEAMALSLPVISTNSTEVISSIIDNHVNGIIVNKNDKSDLVKKIEFVLDNPNIAKKLGIEAGKVKTKYNKNKIIKKWHETFEKLL